MSLYDHQRVYLSLGSILCRTTKSLWFVCQREAAALVSISLQRHLNNTLGKVVIRQLQSGKNIHDTYYANGGSVRKQRTNTRQERERVISRSVQIWRTAKGVSTLNLLDWREKTRENVRALEDEGSEEVTHTHIQTHVQAKRNANTTRIYEPSSRKAQ